MESEKMPKWLENYQIGQGPSLKQFLQSRLVFMPDPGGQILWYKRKWPFGNVYCAVWIWCESVFPQDRGNLLDVQSYSEDEINAAAPWRHHLTSEEISCQPAGKSFARLCIYERNGDEPEDGPQRLAILYVHDDGVSLFDQLFCNRNAASNFCLVVLCNYGFKTDRYAKDGLCSVIAGRARVWPEYLLTDQEPWRGYERCADTEQLMIDYKEQYLYRRIPQREDCDVYLLIRDRINGTDMLKLDAPPTSWLRVMILRWCREHGLTGEVQQQVNHEFLVNILAGKYQEEHDTDMSCIPCHQDILRAVDNALQTTWASGACWVIVKRRI